MDKYFRSDNLNIFASTTNSDKIALFLKSLSSFICSISTKVTHHSKYTLESKAHTSFLMTEVHSNWVTAWFITKFYLAIHWTDLSSVCQRCCLISVPQLQAYRYVCVCEYTCVVSARVVESCYEDDYIWLIPTCVSLLLCQLLLDFICLCCHCHQALLSIKLMLFEAWFWFQFFINLSFIKKWLKEMLL